MKREDDTNRLDEMLARHLHRESDSFDFEQWARRFPEDARLLQSGFSRPISSRTNQLVQMGRSVMTSRYTKFAGVAAMVVVVISVLFPTHHGIVPESVAWADVQEAMERRAYRSHHRDTELLLHGGRDTDVQFGCGETHRVFPWVHRQDLRGGWASAHRVRLRFADRDGDGPVSRSEDVLPDGSAGGVSREDQRDDVRTVRPMAVCLRRLSCGRSQRRAGNPGHRFSRSPICSTVCWPAWEETAR